MSGHCDSLKTQFLLFVYLDPNVPQNVTRTTSANSATIRNTSERLILPIQVSLDTRHSTLRRLTLALPALRLSILHAKPTRQ